MTKSMYSSNILKRFPLFTLQFFFRTICIANLPPFIFMVDTAGGLPHLHFIPATRTPTLLWKVRWSYPGCNRSLPVWFSCDKPIPCFPSIPASMGWQGDIVLTSDTRAIIRFLIKRGTRCLSSLLLCFLPASNVQVTPEDTPAILWPWGSSPWGKDQQKHCSQCQPWHHGATESHARSPKLLNMSEKKESVSFSLDKWIFMLLEADHNILSDKMTQSHFFF